MPMKSETSRLIDQIIKTGPAPLLKEAGYRKLARSFHADAGGLFKVVQFQSSMWNTPDSARFTVNLNIALSYFHEKCMGEPFPKNPGSAAPVLSQRIGYLMPEQRDFWWEVTPKSDVDGIASHLTKALSEGGLPFLDRHANIQALTEAAEQAVERKGAMHPMTMNPELGLAILLSFQGKAAEAARVLQDLAKNNTHAGFAETIAEIAERLELKLAI
jgi:hypothetical protein